MNLPSWNTVGSISGTVFSTVGIIATTLAGNEVAELSFTKDKFTPSLAIIGMTWLLANLYGLKSRGINGLSMGASKSLPSWNTVGNISGGLAVTSFAVLYTIEHSKAMRKGKGLDLAFLIFSAIGLSANVYGLGKRAITWYRG